MFCLSYVPAGERKIYPYTRLGGFHVSVCEFTYEMSRYFLFLYASAMQLHTERELRLI